MTQVPDSQQNPVVYSTPPPNGDTFMNQPGIDVSLGAIIVLVAGFIIYRIIAKYDRFRIKLPRDIAIEVEQPDKSLEVDEEAGGSDQRSVA